MDKMSHKASSSCNSRAPVGLHIPKGVPENVSDDPYYAFILTNVKTYDELNERQSQRAQTYDGFVLHSLRLFKQHHKRRNGSYDESVDYLYSQDIEKISPGLKEGKTFEDHRKYQYEKHGYHIHGLTQIQYFQNMTILYDHFNINAKLGEITRELRDEIRTARISNHHWEIVNIKTHDEKLKSKLNDCSFGIYYAVDPNGKKFVFEYELYLNERFQIVDGPPKDTTKQFDPVYHEGEFPGDEKA